MAFDPKHHLIQNTEAIRLALQLQKTDKSPTQEQADLKAMALEGHGVAFLAHSPVKKELRSRRLVSAAPVDSEGLQMTMDVRAYREKPAGKEAPKGTAQALWMYLQAQAGSC